MRVAFWTASAFARPFHALQQWWQDRKGSTTALSNGLPSSSQAVPSLTLDRLDIAANHSAVTQSIVVKRAPTLLTYHRLSPSPKNHCTISRATATRRHGPQRPARMLRGTASTQQTGHFFISGRMADVCAELERLAAHEAAH